MRPLPTDHPNFTGSNPTYAGGTYTSGFNPCWDGVSTYGQTPAPFSWDVDNDGDGVPDSVWVDLGFPVRTADGRLYKPLFAILCVDLDGRLNLNAHGSLAQLNSGSSNGPSLVAGSATDDNVRGQGLGPAEISLVPVLGGNLQQVFGTGSTAYEGRYGSRGQPGSGTTTTDPVFANKWFNYGPASGTASYWDFSNVNNVGSYGSPPDPFGVGNVTLDTAGRPIYKWTTANSYGFGSGIADSPYQLNLGPNANRGLTSTATNQNNLFSPSELERLLRPYDADAPSLPPRLAALTGSTASATQILEGRLNMTTESWDVPCLNLLSPAPARAAPSAASITRMSIIDRLVNRGIPQSKWGQLLPPELFAGLKMNINRPFGNGLDAWSRRGRQPGRNHEPVGGPQRRDDQPDQF